MGHGFGHPGHLPDDAGPPTVAQQMDFKDETIPRQDLPEQTKARPDLGRMAPPLPPPAPSAPPASTVSEPSSFSDPSPSLPKPPSGRTPSPSSTSHDSSGDLTVVMMSNFACAAGALFIVAAQEPWHRPMGLFVCLAGAFLSIAILVTSDRGRKAASCLGVALLGRRPMVYVYDQTAFWKCRDHCPGCSTLSFPPTNRPCLRVRRASVDEATAEDDVPPEAEPEASPRNQNHRVWSPSPSPNTAPSSAPRSSASSSRRSQRAFASGSP